MNYSPKDVEDLVGIATASLREQRTRFPYPFGKQQENGRWNYSSVDLIGMACISLLEGSLPSQFEAARVAHWIAPEVARHIGLTSPATWNLQTRNIAPEVFPDAEGKDQLATHRYAIFGSGNPIITNRAELQSDLGEPVMQVIRLDLVAAALPKKLVARLLADEVAD